MRFLIVVVCCVVSNLSVSHADVSLSKNSLVVSITGEDAVTLTTSMKQMIGSDKSSFMKCIAGDTATTQSCSFNPMDGVINGADADGIIGIYNQSRKLVMDSNHIDEKNGGDVNIKEVDCSNQTSCTIEFTKFSWMSLLNRL